MSSIRRALALALLAALVYWATPAAAGRLDKHPAVYFDQLADAFLHGRLYLIDPPLTHDLTLHDGRWYVPFPPGPALLMLPLVAAFGPGAAFEIPFSAELGGLSVGLLYIALIGLRRRGWIETGERTCLGLAGLFAFGTVFWITASTGSVWHLAHVVTVACLMLALALAAHQAQPGWIGLALAGAILTRPSLALAVPFFIAELWVREDVSGVKYQVSSVMCHVSSIIRSSGQPQDHGLRITHYALRISALLLPPLFAAAGLLWYNAARFGNPLEFGYRASNVDSALARDLAEHGLFSLHYLGRNLSVAFAGLPDFLPRFPFFIPNPIGMSVFLTTPALLYLFKRRPQAAWEWAALGTILLLNIPLLLYYNTGWQQFGYRFSLDYLVFAICLIAAYTGRKASPLLAFLIGLSALMNLRGIVWWFGGG